MLRVTRRLYLTILRPVVAGSFLALLDARGIWRGVGRQRGEGSSAVVLCGWLGHAGAETGR